MLWMLSPLPYGKVISSKLVVAMGAAGSGLQARPPTQPQTGRVLAACPPGWGPVPTHGPQGALRPHVCGSKAKVAPATRGAVARGVLPREAKPAEIFSLALRPGPPRGSAPCPPAHAH